jgi:hypothetical protein
MSTRLGGCATTEVVTTNEQGNSTIAHHTAQKP